MKNFTIVAIAVFLSIIAVGQVPQGITYQSVVRNPDGTIVSNETLSFKLTIRSGAADGQIEYVEIHNTQSNTFGLVNLIIGSGIVQEGDFTSINWGGDAMFLETAIDIGNTGIFETMGVTQFLSVPYSMVSGNGVHSMTTEQRDALENPPLGMQIFNITTNCINYFNGFGWYETCGDCTPLPSQANAGPDQLFTDETTTAQMAANTPESGEGLWSVVSGENGSFDDPSNPMATFIGQPCEIYTLAWTITSPCGANEDLVEIVFNTPPSIADAGPDQTFNDATISATLAANAPAIGTGTWTVETGVGGSFLDVNDPTTIFTGEPCETYTLKWAIANDCGTTEDLVEIIYNTPPTTADAGADQLDVQGTSTTLAGNTPVLGTGTWSLLSGTGGTIAEPSNPSSSFSGTEGFSYELQWIITNDCGTSSDTVIISFAGATGSFECGQPFTDTRDGLQYETVLIGDQCWMAENLNIGTRIDGIENQTDNSTIEKYCYDNDPANCDTYGGLYQWDEMMQYSTEEGMQGICPDGWHLPTDAEWCTLEQEVDPTITCNSTGFRGVDGGGKLKETGTTHWNSPNTGATNSSGFTALPGGTRNYDGSLFLRQSIYGFWWSSSQYDISSAWRRYLRYDNAQVDRTNLNKSYGFSVRCIKSDYTPINLPPETPSDPNPEDGATNQPVEATLSWTSTDPDSDPLTYDVYFGIENPPAQVSTGQIESTFDLGTLQYTTEYFWKIVAHDDQGNFTEGPVWSFTTEEEAVAFTCGETFTDNRDGQTYQTVQIGDQCWMAENLNIGTRIDGIENQTDNSTIEKYCYDNDPANCDTYGGLYQWNEMMQYTTAEGVQGICPDGWHLPADAEWMMLEEEVESTTGVNWNTTEWRGTDAGGNLKETGTAHWQTPNSGATNSSGFSALPGGYWITTGSFTTLGSHGWFWSSTEDNSTLAWYRALNYSVDEVYRNFNSDKSNGFSVRCIKSDFTPLNQAPEAPSNPNPEDGATNQPVEATLSWTSADPDNDPLTYDVYFGIENLPAQVSTGQSESTFDLGTLQYTTEYFWKIVAHDDHGNSTEGPVWSFTTEEEAVAFTCGETFTDNRDGQTYQTVQIGDQCWMAENLAYLPSVFPLDSVSYNTPTIPYYYVYDYNGTDVSAAKATSAYQTYGVLYNWTAAMNNAQSSTSVPSGVQGVCPSGWYLPSDEEWKILEGEVDSFYNYPDPVWDMVDYRGTDAHFNLMEEGTTH